MHRLSLYGCSFLLSVAACSALAAPPRLPPPHQARYGELLAGIESRCAAKGHRVRFEVGSAQVRVRRFAGATELDSVVVELSEDDGLPTNLGHLDYVAEHWRQVRFTQSVSEVRFFDGRDERVVYGFAVCDWKWPDDKRRACRDRRRQELVGALEQVLREVRTTRRLPATPAAAPAEDDHVGRLRGVVAAWGARCPEPDPVAAALTFFARSASRMKSISGARERVRDSYGWVRPFLPLLRGIFRAHGVPEDLVFLSSTEAHFRPFLRSSAGAVGPWQFMPATARERGLRVDGTIDERRDLLRSAEAASRYLAEQFRNLGDWGLAAIAYNQGGRGALEALIAAGTNQTPELIARARARGGRLGGRKFHVGAHYWPILVGEVRGFTALAEEVRTAEAGTKAGTEVAAGSVGAAGAEAVASGTKVAGADATQAAETGVAGADAAKAGSPDATRGSWTAPLDLFHLPLAAAARVDDLARMAGIPAPELLALNLALGPDRRHEVYRGLYHDRPLSTVLRTLPTSGVVAPAGCVLNLPARSREAFLAAYLPHVAAQGARKVRVRRGDTLWSLARKHGLTVDQLARFNGLDREARLRTGATLAVLDGSAVTDVGLEHWRALVDLAHRAESAHLDGRLAEAVRHYADLARSEGSGFLGAHARGAARRLAERLVRGLRYGLDGHAREPLRAAALLAEWLEPGDGAVAVPDPEGRLQLAWARALISIDDPWRARRALEDLQRRGRQVSAARALLRGLEPGALGLESVALWSEADLDLAGLRRVLNPDPARFSVDVARVADLAVCVRTGDRLGLRDGGRTEMTWPAEPWCGGLGALRARVAASLGEDHALDLERSAALRYSVGQGARVPLVARPRPDEVP